MPFGGRLVVAGGGGRGELEDRYRGSATGLNRYAKDEIDGFVHCSAIHRQPGMGPR